MKEEMDNLRMERDRVHDLRTSMGNPRSGLATSRVGAPDDRKKIRDLEQLL